MITLHDPSAEDWSGNGLCLLQPTVCEVEEEAGGMYELRLTHPITDDLRANIIQRGMLIKAPVPARETPLIQISAEGHAGQAEHDIWKVKVAAANLWSKAKGLYPTFNISTSYAKGAKVRYNGRSYMATTATIGIAPSGVGWKSISSPSSVLQKLKQNNELVYHGAVDGTWSKVTTATGLTGYIKTADAEYLRTDPYIPALPTYQTAIPPRQIKEQLFRIYNVETDSKGRVVIVQARHIFYDLLGNIIKSYRAMEQNPQDALNAIAADFCNEHDFQFYTNLTGTVSSECTLRNGVEALLDTDIGIVPQKNALLVRDNDDVFILENTEIDRGVTIAYGKNMLGIKVTEDQGSLITRIIPIGKDADGKPLKLPEIYIDSPHIADYPTPHAKSIEYDVQVKEATDDEEAVTTEQAYEKLRGKVADEFSKGCDLPDIDVEVEYVNLGDTEEYKAYKKLQRVFLYDTVHSSYQPMGMEFAMQVTGYAYDAILQCYKKTKLSTKLVKREPTIAGAELPQGGILGVKIAMGSLDGSAMRELSIRLGNIAKDLWALAPLGDNPAVANAVTLEQYTAEMAKKANAEALAAFATISNLNAQVEYAAQNAQSAISAALAKALAEVAKVDTSLLGYKSEINEYMHPVNENGEPVGLEITFPGSPFSVRITNDRIQMLQSGEEVAFFAFNRMNNTAATFGDRLSIGNPDNGYFDLISTSRGLSLKTRDA